MAYPLAYLLTWTTYGTWLHGDARGSIGEDCRYMAPREEPCPVWEEHERSRLAGGEHTLSHEARGIVAKAITDHASIREWHLLAASVLTTHAHVVVACPCEPEKPLREFKAWATRRLREAEIIGPEQKAWTHHGSTRYLWDEASVRAAADYINRFQTGELRSVLEARRRGGRSLES